MKTDVAKLMRCGFLKKLADKMKPRSVVDWLLLFGIGASGFYAGWELYQYHCNPPPQVWRRRGTIGTSVVYDFFVTNPNPVVITVGWRTNNDHGFMAIQAVITTNVLLPEWQK